MQRRAGRRLLADLVHGDTRRELDQVQTAAYDRQVAIAYTNIGSVHVRA